MLRVVGAEGTSEYAAAVALGDMIADALPQVRDNPQHQVVVVANAKCHGQRTRDIDVLLLARFAPGVSVRRTLPFTGPLGRAGPPSRIEVRSLALVIEVKDHRPQDVRFVGTRVEVYYADGWKDASEQNDKQVHAVRRYLAYHRLPAPYLTGLLWLRNVPDAALPPRPHSLLGTPLSWELLVNVVAQLAPPVEAEGTWLLEADDASRGWSSLLQIGELFTKVLQPTRLDRLRMERATQRGADIDALVPTLGQRLLILRGRGGTGKTMRLIQVAHRLSTDQGARVLILTYNRALVADVRRLLTILGIPDDITGGTIRIQTVHSFLYALLTALGVTAVPDESFLDRYEELKDEALALLGEGALTRADLDSLLSRDQDTFDWEYVLVDEGQDWPANERDLLFQLYPFSRVAVADGIDQLVRSAAPINWRQHLASHQAQVVALRCSLRMKAGLARFATAMARNLGLLADEWEPNEELPGGYVLVVDGPYLRDRSLHERLLQQNADDRNQPVDMLFCVPPDMVITGRDGEARSTPAAVFEQWGYPTWDGASDRVRDGYPTDVAQLRIVQYESCRGLEGWIVVNFALDRFYVAKRAQGAAAPAEPGMLTGDASAADRYAARWLMIPLTRAMDTLVIQLDQGASPVRSALEAAAAECGDYVEWIITR